MVARKRAREEMEVEEPAEEPSMLQTLRSMWQFANLAQYLHLFKGALKIDDDFDIEELETECLKPQPSSKLADIGLALLKHVSSHKGLTPDIFDEYTRRQFVAKAPTRNPFGEEEIPNKFDDFDVFTKIRVLQQLSLWTLNNPNTIRERLNPTEAEQADWRFGPFGWDSQGRTMFVLDDFRLYRRTDPPPPQPPPKAKSKAKPRKSKSTRSSKRRKQSTPEPETPVEDDEPNEVEKSEEVDGLGGMKWECICVTLEDYQDYMGSIRKSRDPDEKELYKRIEVEILPELSRVAEEQARKEARKMKELEVLQKLANAKRSSRISARLEKQKETEIAEEADRKRRNELAMAKAEQEKQKRMEEAHESRRQTREQRLREREAAKILHEENMRKLQEEEEKVAAGEARKSERHLKAQMSRAQKELKKLKESDYWIFDCEKCSMRGECLNDGSHQIQCERCDVWQHSKCHGIPEEVADSEDYKFVCSSCRRKEQAAKEPKLPPLKLRLGSSPSSHNVPRPNGIPPIGPARQPEAVGISPQRPSNAQSPPRPVQPVPSLMNGPSLSPRGQALGPPGIHRSEAAYGSSFSHTNGSSPPRPYSHGGYGGAPMGNGSPSSSPPRYQTPSAPANPFITHNTSFGRQNGSPFTPSHSFQPMYSQPYASSFNRPASATGSASQYQSPIKHSPAPSPRPSNGVPNSYNFNSPHSSFPPSSVQGSAFSPKKHSSPPPAYQQMSSPVPAPTPLNFAPSPRQMPAQILPNPIPAPSKHDGVRPVSSHELSEKPILPPIKSLPPSAPPQDLSPPTKKASPTPEKPQFAPVGGNGHLNG